MKNNRTLLCFHNVMIKRILLALLAKKIFAEYQSPVGHISGWE